MRRLTACRVCSHPEREAIETALVGGEPLRSVARRFGGFGKDSASNHRSHITPAIVAVAERREQEHGESLLDEVRALLSEVRAILDKAKSSGSGVVALKAIREAHRLLELRGRVTGELDERPQMTVNLVASPEWVRLRGAILSALEPFPEARTAVVEALSETRALEAG